MDFMFIYGVSLLFLSIIIIGLGIYISFNEKKQYKWIFRGLFFSCFFYTLIQGLVYISSNESLNFVLLSPQLILYPLIFSLWFIFIADYTENPYIKKTKYILLVLLVPIIQLIE